MHKVGTSHDTAKDVGQLVLPVRKDELTKIGELNYGTKSDYGEGKFAALEVDEFGYLRVRLLRDGVNITNAPTIQEQLTRLNQSLEEIVFQLQLITSKL